MNRFRDEIVFVSPGNGERRRISRSTVPGVPGVGRAAPPVGASSSSFAPFRPSASRRSSSNRNLNTNSNTEPFKEMKRRIIGIVIISADSQLQVGLIAYRNL